MLRRQVEELGKIVNSIVEKLDAVGNKEENVINVKTQELSANNQSKISLKKKKAAKPSKKI